MKTNNKLQKNNSLWTIIIYSLWRIIIFLLWSTLMFLLSLLIKFWLSTKTIEKNKTNETKTEQKQKQTLDNKISVKQEQTALNLQKELDVNYENLLIMIKQEKENLTLKKINSKLTLKLAEFMKELQEQTQILKQKQLMIIELDPNKQYHRQLNLSDELKLAWYRLIMSCLPSFDFSISKEKLKTLAIGTAMLAGTVAVGALAIGMTGGAAAPLLPTLATAALPFGL